MASRLIESFCAYVKKNVIDNHRIFYMNGQKGEFVKIVKDLENEDASSYRTFRLKKKGCKRNCHHMSRTGVRLFTQRT